MKKISVIVTTYNAETTIDRTLNSILNQEGVGKEFDIELIVVDDCSTDATIERVKNFDVILLNTKSNSGGPNRGRNLGLSHASGDYICIVDHDDEWFPHKVKTQLPYLEKVPIVTCSCTYYDHLRNVKYDRPLPSKEPYVYFGKNETFLKRLVRDFRDQNEFESSAIYWKGSKDIRYEEYFGMIDYDRQLALYHNRESIEVRQPLFYRHIHEENLSKKGRYILRDSYMSLMAIGLYSAQYPREARKGMKRVFGKLARYYYLYADNMRLARYYFWKSGIFDWKTIAFIFSTYWGSSLVKKRLKKVTGEIDKEDAVGLP